MLKKKRLSRIWKGSLERSSICFYLHFESSYVNPSVVSSQLIQREQIATFYLIPSKKTCWSVRSCHCRTIVNFVRLKLLLLQERSLHLDIHNSRIALTRQDEEISMDGHSESSNQPLKLWAIAFAKWNSKASQSKLYFINAAGSTPQSVRTARNVIIIWSISSVVYFPPSHNMIHYHLIFCVHASFYTHQLFRNKSSRWWEYYDIEASSQITIKHRHRH